MKKFFITALLTSAIVFAPLSKAASFYAPYIDLTLWPTPLIDEVGIHNGIQQLNLAFVVAQNNTCAASWGGFYPIKPNDESDFGVLISSAINNYRGKGGEVTVSFGGANGLSLAQACNTPDLLANEYDKVINTYALKHIDLDIEGAAIADIASIDRLFAALVKIQKKYPQLKISFTLPVMPTGLTFDGINLLKKAVQNKIVFETVNIMTMDYGSSIADMGAAAIDAATATHQQLADIFTTAGQPKTNDQLWQMVGLTPMIGVNDTQNETFTIQNAKTLFDFAQKNKVGFLSIWSITRDIACPSGKFEPIVSPECSGIVQAPFDFTRIFKAFNNHWGTGVTEDPSYVNPTSGKYIPGAQWNSRRVYTAGQLVTYQNALYEAKWWTQGDVPGIADVWLKINKKK